MSPERWEGTLKGKSTPFVAAEVEASAAAAAASSIGKLMSSLTAANGPHFWNHEQHLGKFVEDTTEMRIRRDSETTTLVSSSVKARVEGARLHAVMGGNPHLQGVPKI